MANDLNRSIKIYIDGTEAQAGIAKVQAAVQKLESQLASLNKGEANYEERSKQLNRSSPTRTARWRTTRRRWLRPSAC